MLSGPKGLSLLRKKESLRLPLFLQVNALCCPSGGYIAPLKQRHFVPLFLRIAIEEALALSIAERIQLVGDLWESISEIPEAVELSQQQRLELRRRIKDYRENPQIGISWDDLKSEIDL
ncbi:addiction module protein [bacterium]|nr:addiction module protein [bacterium]